MAVAQGIVGVASTLSSHVGGPGYHADRSGATFRRAVTRVVLGVPVRAAGDPTDSVCVDAITLKVTLVAIPKAYRLGVNITYVIEWEY